MEVKSVTIFDMKGTELLSIEDRNIVVEFDDAAVGVTYDSRTGSRCFVMVPFTNISKVIAYE